jgi:acetyl esterase/lipase
MRPVPAAPERNTSTATASSSERGAVRLLGRVWDTLYTTLGLAWLEIATPRRGYTRERGIAYGPHPRHRLDLYLPDALTDFAPALVFLYGGGWRSGTRKIYRFVGQCFASAGLPVAIPDYRVYPQTIFPGFVEDAAGAVAWVARNLAAPDGSARPLVLVGMSAGAHMAALLHLDPRYLKAAGLVECPIAGTVGLCGPYNFLPIQDPEYQPIFPRESDRDSQPIDFVTGAAPPMLLLTGDADTTVSPENTRSLAAAIRDTGGTVRETILPGVDHLAPLLALAAAIPGRKLPVRSAILGFIRDVTGFVPH